MKNIFYIYILFVFTSALAQETPIAPATHSESNDRIYYDTANRVVGSHYFFKNWNNTNTILFTDDTSIHISNININIQNNTFEKKDSKTRHTIYDTKFVKHVIINEKIFKSLYFDKIGGNKIFEIIFESEKISFLKGYEVVFIKGIVNPVVTEAVDKNVIRKKYYIKQGNIRQIKLKKKAILSLFNDKKDEVTKYAKKNRLSYKREKDLRQIFSYYTSL